MNPLLTQMLGESASVEIQARISNWQGSASGDDGTLEGASFGHIVLGDRPHVRFGSKGPNRSRGSSLRQAARPTTALYTRVATKTIREVMSPLEHVALKLKEIWPPA